MDNVAQNADALNERVALYGTKTGEPRTRQYPVRDGVSVPLRYEHNGVEWLLLAVVGVKPGETVDAAILRETRSIDAQIADLLAEEEAGVVE